MARLSVRHIPIASNLTSSAVSLCPLSLPLGTSSPNHCLQLSKYCSRQSGGTGHTLNAPLIGLPFQ
ncbi:hypothetical protein [Bacillus thuringiensis]|uniref:hypothetical protein n=1 Tax=Bacillus thuringiensis TaxID=1428 RepID=UPI001596DCA3|nr:hypothetical protein [Bacillus thuringiensis]